MKYVLDISTLDALSSGAKQRFLNLYSELIKLNKKKDFVIIYTKFNEVRKIFNYQNVNFIKNPFSQEKYLKKIISTVFLFFYIRIKFKKIKTIEYFTLPFFKIQNCKTIFTIHDLRRIYFSTFFLNRFFLTLFFKFFLKKADNIVVVSKAVKNEMTRYFNKLKMTVVYNTIDKSFFDKISTKDTNKIKKKYSLPNNFILTVGHLEKRKNFLPLIKAIKILKNDGQNIRLVIIGQNSDESEKIKSLITFLKLKKNIKIYSKLNDFEVACFYKSANLFVFPSIYEGFGIPLLESMASNLPMVLSNTEIFREVTESKYSYFDQYDPLSIANRIKYVLSNKNLQKQMVKYGEKRINFFSLDVQKKKIDYFYNKVI
tara:strand:+ start:1128 stop:2240 length:1113 start_codon:yes stop_codon:yes gene_type:complete